MSFSKHILILGAGFLQKPAIESAKNLGYHVTVVDANDKAVCIPLAHRFEHIDLKDYEKLEKLCTEMKNGDGLDAVFTAGTDFSAVVSYLAEKNGLPAHSYNSACNATDKARMRTCFASYKVPSPLFIEVNNDFANVLKTKVEKGISSVKELLNIDAKYPLVVKPVDNMGARGCRMCFNGNELRDSIFDAVKYSRTGRAIVEEYMDGKEFSIDSLVFDGKILITGFADRHIFYPPYFIEMGHTMSTTLPEKDLARVANVFAKGVKALGLTCGVAKGDMKLTEKGAMIGEIAARLSGGYMSGWTFPYAAGINLTEQAIKIASGEKPDIMSDEYLNQFQKLGDNVWYVHPKEYSCEKAWVSIPGIVKNIYGLQKATEISFVKNVFPRANVRDSVVFPQNNVEKCGNVITKASTLQEATDSAFEAICSITLRLEPFNQKTEEFLNKETDFPPSAFKISEDDKKMLKDIGDNEAFCSFLPINEQVPNFLEKYLFEKDWNNKTLHFSLGQFAEICPNVKVPAKEFWAYGLRGGLQGFLYAADVRGSNE